MLNRLTYIFVWLSRVMFCRGFGIQSPTDYQFVRYVINEHWPYYAYAVLGNNDTWLNRKLGRLYFRIANWRQPRHVVDRIGAANYLHAGCAKTVIDKDADHIELALLPVTADVQKLFMNCDYQSVVVFQGIYNHKEKWKRIIEDPRVTISFDLYYCGIVMFDKKRTKQHYKINF